MRMKGFLGPLGTPQTTTLRPFCGRQSGAIACGSDRLGPADSAAVLSGPGSAAGVGDVKLRRLFLLPSCKGCHFQA